MSAFESCFYLSEDRVTLTGDVSQVTCRKCGRTLALKNDQALMSKTSITLISKKGQVLLRCGSCKTFNEIGTEKIAV